MVTSVGWAVPTSPCQEHMRGMLLPAGAGHTCMHWQGQATQACTGRGRPHMHVLAGAGHTCMYWQGQPHMHVLRSRLA